MFHPVWQEWFGDETKKPYFRELGHKLKAEWAAGKVIYPVRENIFKAYDDDPLKIKVVIIGQDPYPNAGQAHGLCFSTGNRSMPASLRNIAIELKNEGFDPNAAQSGNLESWAKQGVFLLNRILTVPAGVIKGHADWGWEQFTEKTISVLQGNLTNLVFLLWGATAKEIEPLVDKKKHHVLYSAHPSPMSSHRGFFGNGHFVKTNEILLKNNQEPIKW